MPITIRPSVVKIKKPSTGEYREINALLDTDSAKTVYYGVSSTAAATQTKTVTIEGISALSDGLLVRILFANAQSYSGVPKLMINSTAASNIKTRRGTDATSLTWNAGDVLDFVYDSSSSGFIVLDKGDISNKVSKTGAETIDGSKTFTSPMTIDRSGTATTVDEWYSMLNIRYKNPQGYTKTVGVIRTYGDTEQGSNNGIVIMGSSSGATIIRAGESAEDVIKNESLSNSEDLNLITDNAVKIYVNANTASNVIKALGLSANGHLILANNSEIYDNANTLHLHTPPRSNGIYARYDLEPTGELAAQLTTDNGSHWTPWYTVGDVPRKATLSSSAFTNVTGTPSAILYRYGAFALIRFSGVKIASGTYSGWTTFCTIPSEFAVPDSTFSFYMAMDTNTLLDHGYPIGEARISGTEVQLYAPEANVPYWGSGYFPIGTWLS